MARKEFPVLNSPRQVLLSPIPEAEAVGSTVPLPPQISLLGWIPWLRGPNPGESSEGPEGHCCPLLLPHPWGFCPKPFILLSSWGSPPPLANHQGIL